MAAMRITTDVVRQLANAADDAASEVARAHGKDAPSIHYGQVSAGPDDNGHSKIIASHRIMNWRGPRSTQRAAAFYLGVIDALKGNAYLDLPHPDNDGRRRASEGEWPEVRDALFANFTGAVASEYSDGIDEGNARRSTILR